ncbi:hypothetical protein FRC17_000471 [Serendipita sp. 399]|nr:hypothetical protein FRC17_000471 [Serendipita sp. 399]
MNITVDDTSPNFIWGSGDVWRVQPPNQVTQNSNFFLNTYHAAQAKNARVSITFVGSAFYLYGSTGANHGRYSVTYDGTIKYSSGFSPQTQYRQLLFSNVFGTTAETHTVVIQNEEDFWFDLDFMVLTIATTADTSTTNLGFFASTVTPATAVPSSGSSGSGTVASTPSESSSGSVFRIVSFALAGVIALLIFGIVGWVFCRRQRRRRAAAGASQGSQQEHLQGSYKQGISIDTTVESKGGHGGGKVLSGFTRGRGKDDLSYLQTPTSMSAVTAADHHTQLTSYPPESASMASGSGSAMSGAARETLIALNNMGRRPGYRNLPSESGGRETPTSMKSLGSAGQVWLGANHNASNVSHRESRLRTSSVMNIGHAAETAASSRSGGQTRGQRHQRGREDEYVTREMGLGIYGTNNRSDPDQHQQRMADLRRSASVASSGILDRISSSPPPAVPELPPLAQNGSSNGRFAAGMLRSASPVNSIDSHTDGYSALSFASKIQHPYGKGNEMLVGSNMSTNSSMMMTTPGSPGGAMPLRPPPVRTQQDDRARLLKERERERERAELQQLQQQQQQSQQQQQQQQLRYSRPPPEYAATAPAQNPPPPLPTATVVDESGSFGLRRQGTRTGDIPIAIEGGFNAGDSVENESYESHSVAYVGAATQVNVSSVAARNLPTQHPYQPPAPLQHVRNASAMGSNSSLTATVTGTSAKRAMTPDRGRVYTPDRTMAVPASERGYASGRPSEDRVWTLEGVSAAPQRVASPMSNVGRPIMDDKARLAMGGNTASAPNRQIS